jgi:hypothetical protein
MPIKKLKFSFVVGVEALTKILSEGNSEMNIEVFEDQPRVAKPKEKPQLALPAPGRGRGLRDALLGALRSGQKMTTAELRAVIVAVGYSEQSLSNQVFELHREKLIKTVSRGVYVITKKGLNQ